MAEITSDIPQLRSRLKASRTQLAWGMEKLRCAANVPQRLQRDMMSHPLKWAVIGLVSGAIVVRLIPAAFAIVRLGASRKVVRAALSSVAPIIARAGLNALAARAPAPVREVRGGLVP